MRNLLPFDPGSKGFGDPKGALRIGVGEDDCKFLAPVSGRCIPGAIQGFSLDPGHLYQAVITGLMSIRIIENFEMIDISHNKRHRGPLP